MGNCGSVGNSVETEGADKPEAVTAAAEENGRAPGENGQKPWPENDTGKPINFDTMESIGDIKNLLKENTAVKFKPHSGEGGEGGEAKGEDGQGGETKGEGEKGASFLEGYPLGPVNPNQEWAKGGDASQKNELIEWKIQGDGGVHEVKLVDILVQEDLQEEAVPKEVLGEKKEKGEVLEVGNKVKITQDGTPKGEGKIVASHDEEPKWKVKYDNVEGKQEEGNFKTADLKKVLSAEGGGGRGGGRRRTKRKKPRKKRRTRKFKRRRRRATRRKFRRNKTTKR